ncbi:ThiF family adenylyltransferase [Streptomyces sp. NPDC056061]|uniref:ThiF family adenylyltransferase n=1 Tax=Streptomyces sp. NPDC056061 TaxID=3345700 RepID=UPI0035D5F367
MARMHVGVVGCGSVGMLVVEALARTGIERLSLFDFDTVEEVNLDRLHEATIRDVRLHRAKAHLAARTARRAATATNFRAAPYELSVVEPAGFAAAADCDVIFSCVDRPWPPASPHPQPRRPSRCSWTQATTAPSTTPPTSAPN